MVPETRHIIGEYLESLVFSIGEVLAQSNKIRKVAEVIKKSNLVLTMGNGGSSSTAQHFAQGLCNAGIRTICLTDNTSLLTAISNDKDYKESLGQQVVLFAQNRKRVTIVAISASGDSPNILEAVTVANAVEARTIGLIGFEGGNLKDIAKLSIVLSSKDYGVVEDAHLTICHIVERLIKSG